MIVDKQKRSAQIDGICCDCDEFELSTLSAPKQIYLEDAEEFEKQSKTYRKVLEHRRNCKKWTKEFCLDCFGGGLTQFSSDLEHEYKNRTDSAFNSPKIETDATKCLESSDTHFQTKKEIDKDYD